MIAEVTYEHRMCFLKQSHSAACEWATLESSCFRTENQCHCCNRLTRTVDQAASFKLRKSPRGRNGECPCRGKSKEWGFTSSSNSVAARLPTVSGGSLASVVALTSI